MAEVFVSYSREDERRIAALVQALQAHGLSVFWDRQIPPGKTWREHIGAQLAGARCVIVAWSRHSIVSDFVAEEADDARQRGVLVPVLIDPVLPALGFRSLQAADLCDLQPGAAPRDIATLLRAVDERLAAPGPPPGANPPAAPAAAAAPSASARPRWIAGAVAALVAAAALVAWLALRQAPGASPSVQQTEASGRDARALPALQVRVVDAWRTDDGGVAVRLQVQHRGAEAITVDGRQAFGLIGTARAAAAPAESRPVFETLQPGAAVDFELRFGPVEGASALLIGRTGSAPYEVPLPPLR